MHIPQIHKINSQKICVTSIIYWLISNKYNILEDYYYFLRIFYYNAYLKTNMNIFLKFKILTFYTS